MSKAAKISLKVLKVLGWILLAIVILLVLIVLFIRSPWGQDIIVGKAVNFAKEKIGTEVAIDRLFITFSGNVFLEGVYLEDQQADTLLYSESLETGVAILPLIRSGAIHVSKLEWEGLKANVFRGGDTGKFNFDFIMEAFQSDTTVVEPAPTDTTSTLPDIDLGPINMKNFNLSYVDEVMGLEGRFQLGELLLDMERIDLTKMDFYIKDFLFSNSSVYYKQTKPFEATEEDTTAGGPMPLVIVDRFAINNVKAYYESQPDGMMADVTLGDFLVELPEGNLEDNKIRLRTLNLHDSEVILKMTQQDPSVEAVPDTVSGGGFEWPDWVVEVREISLDRNRIVYQSGEENPQVGRFNPDAIDINNLSLLLNNISLRDNEARLSLSRFSFEELSGFVLREAQIALSISEEATRISDLKIATNRSSLAGDISIGYATLDDLINNPEKSTIDLGAQISADIRDAFIFSPQLASDTTLLKASQKPIVAELRVGGSLEAVDISKAEVNWGNSTRLQARGTVTNPMDTERLHLDLPVLNFRSQRADLLAFVDENQMGLRLPEEIRLESQLRGSLNDMLADVRIRMPEGEIKLDGHYINTDQIAFNADLQVVQLQLDQLLQNDQFGAMSFDIHAEGKGSSLEDLDAVLTSDFKELVYNNNDFSGLVLEGEMADGKGKLDLLFEGENLDVVLEALAELDSVSPTYQVNLDLRGADLFNLGLTAQELRAALQLNATFEGNPEAFDLKTTISDGVVVYDRRPFQLGPVELSAQSQGDSTSLDLTGDILNVRLRSNSSIANLNNAIQRHISSYLSDSTYADSSGSTVEMTMTMGLQSTPILQQVFLEGLEQMDSISMNVDFREADRLLTASLDLPYVLYNNIEVDSLRLRVKADQENLGAALGLISVEAGPLSMGRTYLSGRTEDQQFHVDLVSFDEEDVLFQIGSHIGMIGDTLEVRIEPDELVLNRMNWTIPADNRLLIADRLLRFENFIWQSGNQELSVSNEVEDVDVEEEHLGVSFKNFRLSSITSLLNPDTLVADGLLNGRLIMENLFAATGIIADVNIDSLKVTDVPLGTLSLDAQAKGGQEYVFNMALKEGDIDLDLVGDYVAADSGANLNLDLAINEIKLKAVEALSGDQIRDAEGNISGQVQLSGTTANPVYEGDFRFNDAVFTVSTLNSRFTLSNEAVNLDNSGVYLSNFTITDAENNSFVIGGEVLTEDMTNPSFNLKLNAENFRALNSSREDNDLFYGDLIMNANIAVTGDLNQPQIKGRLKINNDSELTFIIPESQLDIVERDGVVVFVDRENPNEILTKRETEQTTSELTGVQLSAIVEVEPEAVFNIIVDESSGDNLQIGGEADLNVNMDPNGRITLSGKYEVNKGHYEMSLYNLVSRRFEIDEGSSVTWGGDPMDAVLSIRAIYRVETSASELMASQLSGAESELANQFRQELPFLVYLNVDGELLRPLISFGLDMPEDQQGAIGGNVYTRVQQVNTQEDELNKQVFSLLVLNRFFPATGSDGSGGGTAAMARSSVSQMLSGQLNAFSNSLFGGSGLELDFDLDSFQDYQEGAGQTRTQLNVSAQQRLFDDRLVVQVGSQMDVEGGSQSSERANPVFGNVSVEYLLTENGRYRLRGFRKNQFESVIDGQLIVTGISLIFNREFNKFWELWKGIDPEEQEIKPDLERTPSDKRKEDDEEDKKKTEAEDSPTAARTEENDILMIRND